MVRHSGLDSRIPQASGAFLYRRLFPPGRIRPIEKRAQALKPWDPRPASEAAAALVATSPKQNEIGAAIVPVGTMRLQPY
jgi:hypothetical protein